MVKSAVEEHGDETSCRPYTVLSCSISMDGYISSPSGGPLTLSNDADFDRVDAVRASCDAIMVGAETIRSDNPRLIIRDPARISARTKRGMSADPLKVTVTSQWDLSPSSAFFTTGGDKLVYCTSNSASGARRSLRGVATVVDGGQPLHMRWIAADLYRRGIRRLMVEGGGTMHTQFLVHDLADELHLVIAPLFVGDSRARRFVADGTFPWHPGRRGRLADTQQIGDVVLLRYALSDRFDHARAAGGGSV